jgi:tetratricopeptide (TPR) repeat protein
MEEAIAQADEAVKASGDAERLYTRLTRVEILEQAGRFDAAVAECRELLKDHTQAGDVRNIRRVLSTVYSARHDFAKAEEQLKLVLKDDPNDATVNNDLGYMWADQGRNLKEAEELIRKALDLDRRQRQAGAAAAAEEKDNAAFLDSLGWVLFRRGEVEAARKELEQATALPDGEDPVIWDHLGDVYYRLDQPERARTAWKKAQTLYGQKRRRQKDDQYKELQHKLKLLEPEAQPR